MPTNKNILEDLKLNPVEEGYDVLLSNVTGVGGIINNFRLVSSLLQQINIEKLNLAVLDEIFCAFIKGLGFTPKYEQSQFNDVGVGMKLKQPVFFDYDNLTWSGKLIWHKWKNNDDGNNIWCTYSIKLPNDGYLYHVAYQKKEDGLLLLKDNHNHKLRHALEVALDFFDDDKISVRVFYMARRSRLNIKVKSDKLKAWLQITFEYGFPKQNKITGWYTKAKMQELLKG